MSEKSRYSELLQILQSAIQRELLAANLYAESAAKANLPEAKALFEQLAQEEQGHCERLQTQYEKLAGQALYEEE